MPRKTAPLIRIAISSCLLGEKIRYDGGHKLDRFITETLGSFFQWVPVCPEIEAGFETPREAMRLEKTSGDVHLKTIKTHLDLTLRMKRGAKARIEALSRENISGYILKSKSPSCGLAGVRICGSGSFAAKTGKGLFAQALVARFPDLPMEEEIRLCNPCIRENWIQRVFAFYRLNQLWDSHWTAGSLQVFHAEHKLTLLSHSPQGSRMLGQLVAEAKSVPRKTLQQQYQSGFMRIMSAAATPGKHANVLQQAAGCLKGFLDSESKREIQDYIENYRNGLVPLAVPFALIRRYVHRFNISCLAGQGYFNPYPQELFLLNHV